MIKQIQKKFIKITMFSSLVVVFILIGAINAMNLYSMNTKLTMQLSALEENVDGAGPEKEQKPDSIHDLKKEKSEHEKQLRYFSVIIDDQNEIETIDTGTLSEQLDIDAQKFVSKVLEHGKKTGYLGYYKYCVSSYGDGKKIIFLYCESELAMAKETFWISIAVAGLMLLVMFVLVVSLSKRAIKPLIESSEKQKQFITDAGHEIKTPLGIISANADVLELMNGQSEWTDSIHHQVVRLDALVKNLLLLSKMEETKREHCFRDFNMSEVVYNGAKNFCAVAEAKKITFEFDVEADLMFYGEVSEIEQLVSILVDNAMKYVTECGEVKVALSKNKHKKQIYFEVYNTTQKLETKELNRLFERFYRSDASRSRQSGGYGIGLSIAKSIVELHKGKITAKSADGTSISFCVTLPIMKSK